jgi:hypothetical protein
MTVNKGLTALIDSDPNLSNQALENAINELKIGWVVASIELDTAITDNTVLSTSQKNDVKNTINNIAYLNVGRYLNDMIRHTNTILDGSIMPFDASAETKTFTFIEALQTVDALQTTIPELFGVPASSKGRSVNDHFGILNNMFTATEDSTRPVFTSLSEIITFINTGALAQDTAYQTALTNLKNFIASVVGDSTDFQQTLNTFASAVASAATAFDTPLQSGVYAERRTQLINDRNSIVTQQTLENSNIISLRTYIESITNNDTLAGLAENKDMRDLLTNVSQNTTWQNYYNDYETNKSTLNPVYEVSTDSDKASTIDLVLESRGLPDVEDYLDFEAVANKAKQDTRIDTKDYDYYSSEQIITKSCEQLGITTANRSIEDQSNSLLSNMNNNDREIVANELDLNESTNTLS